MHRLTESLVNNYEILWEEFEQNPPLRKRSNWGFDDPIRLNWQNATEKRGVKLSELSSDQVEQCLSFIPILFAESGQKKLSLMMRHNDPSLFSFCFYGPPSLQLPWGFSFEGPNLSLNYTLYGGNLSFTPMLFGANPTKVDISIEGQEGPQIEDIMIHEEGIATDLISMFGWIDLLRIRANRSAPENIIHNFKREVDYTPKGLSIDRFKKENQQYFIKMLISVYLSSRMNPQIAEAFTSRMRGSLSDIKFRWMGQTEQDSRHYYSIMGPTFIIEYLNKETGKNDVLTVFREKGYDFGEAFVQ